MAIFSEGGTSSPDFPLMVCFIVLPLIAIPLNYLVLYHNYKKRSSVARTLFLILAGFDLIGCPYLAWRQAIGLWQPKDQNCFSSDQKDICSERYYLYLRPNGTIPCAVYTAGMWLFTFGPIQITGILTLARLLQITRPLRHIRQSYIVTPLLVLFTVKILQSAVFYIANWPNTAIFATYSQTCNPMLGTTLGGLYISRRLVVQIVGSANAIIQAVGVGSSALTLYYMAWRYFHPVSSTSPRSIKGTLKILLMNAVSLTSFILFGMMNVLYSAGLNLQPARTWEDLIMNVGDRTLAFYILNYTAILVFPVVCSVLNPLIYLALTDVRGRPSRGGRSRESVQVTST